MLEMIGTVVATAIEIDNSLEVPLAVIYPPDDLDVVDQSGRILMRISSRPFFVPLTRQEASRVMAVAQMVGVSVLRPSSGNVLLASMNTELTEWPNESET